MKVVSKVTIQGVDGFFATRTEHSSLAVKKHQTIQVATHGDKDILAECIRIQYKWWSGKKVYHLEIPTQELQLGSQVDGGFPAEVYKTALSAAGYHIIKSAT